MFKHCVLAALIVLQTSACSQANLSVDSAIVRAPVAQRDVTAAFMTITNNSATDIKLRGAQTAAAKRVELHQHTHDGGTMRMRQVDHINIPANSSVSLQPGGYHMMLIGVAPRLGGQEAIDITLQFSNEEFVDITAPVRSVLD